MLFSKLALWLLSHYSRGIPRLINVLAHKALLLSYGAGLSRAGWWQIYQAAVDTEDVQQPSRGWLTTAAIVAVLSLLLSLWLQPSGMLALWSLP
jgi:MSHA biogenesis protein MshM